MNRAIAATTLIALAGCASTPAPTPQTSVVEEVRAPVGHSPNDPMFQFAGTWEGTLSALSGPNLGDATGRPPNFRIVIDAQNSVAVFHRNKNGDIEEVKRGSFSLSRWGSQAVVWAIDSGHDEDGTWVEGWTFCLVHLDRDTLVAYWLRNVNNLDISRTDENYHFAFAYSGQMHSVSGPGHR